MKPTFTFIGKIFSSTISGLLLLSNNYGQ